ncbi:hypothetical protein IVB18_50530 (plasmid) [Bradyrhizobium sp. 186]|uniref:hypothetical protein n=1 Tax=Bradyrhizobium sp. 186 TaxID=2782654 RepID=UPI00200186FB|nr:hypothetical protein [Bradyrhizobium sp. 186]UPK40861.1 hypothetical protein IVB18_50530 [Bradyrhizobium sp. 186]
MQDRDYYLSLRRKYEPAKPKLVTVAEAPPASGGAKSLFKGDTHPDFVIFVWFIDATAPDLCRIFVVPAQTVSNDVLKAHRHWHSRPTREGQQPKGADRPVISWKGRDMERSISNNFSEKWKKYEDAWKLLDG